MFLTQNDINFLLVYLGLVRRDWENSPFRGHPCNLSTEGDEKIIYDTIRKVHSYPIKPNLNFYDQRKTNSQSECVERLNRRLHYTSSWSGIILPSFNYYAYMLSRFSNEFLNESLN